MRVKFKYKSGVELVMARHYADILQKLGRGTYLTRDMQAKKAGSAETKSEVEETAKNKEPKKPARKSKGTK